MFKKSRVTVCRHTLAASFPPHHPIHGQGSRIPQDLREKRFILQVLPPERRFRIVNRFPLLLLATLLCATGCRTPHPIPPADFSDPAWKLHHGQAVWRPNNEAQEVAGDLLVATRSDGQFVVQFTKVPVPLVVARRSPRAWEIQFPSDGREASGRLPPPERLIWLHLPDALRGEALPPGWTFERLDHGLWRLSAADRGEFIEGYLEPDMTPNLPTP
jgi:hypothetical protein